MHRHAAATRGRRAPRACLLVLCLALAAGGDGLDYAFAEKIRPAVFGLWRAGQVRVAAEGGGTRPAGSLDPALSDASVLPEGMLVRLSAGRDPKTGDALSVMTLHAPWPEAACRHPVLRDFCARQEGGAARPPSSPVEWEFTLDFSRRGADTLFAAVGARPSDPTYGVLVNGRLWRGDFYVERGGRRMWSAVTYDAVEPDADGMPKKAGRPVMAYQSFQRLQEN